MREHLQNDIDHDKIDEQTGLSEEVFEDDNEEDDYWWWWRSTNQHLVFDFHFPIFNNQLLK